MSYRCVVALALDREHRSAAEGGREQQAEHEAKSPSGMAVAALRRVPALLQAGRIAADDCEHALAHCAGSPGS